MIKIFKYIPDVGCFIVDPLYKELADKLGLTEWNEVVWIGRYFFLDDDVGEHWFDNWPERDALCEKAKQHGIEYDDILALDPDRFKRYGATGYHSDEERILFWKDVLNSLSLSFDTIVREAINFNRVRQELQHEPYIEDLEERINTLKEKYNL